MRHRRKRVATTVLKLLIVGIAGGLAACRNAPVPVVDADTVLRRMSLTLASAQRVAFTARREIDPDLLAGRDLQALTTIKVRLVRPNRIAVQLESEGDRRAMYSDGSSFTLQHITKNLYATVPLKVTLDDLGEQMERIYGFAPPLAEFVTNKPYENIQARVTGSSYLGQASTDAGVKCYRIAVTGEAADAELWVSVDDNLPRQLIATFRSIPSHPQSRLFFSEWNLAATFPDSELAFTPPAGAVKIPMKTVAEMEALATGKKR